MWWESKDDEQIVENALKTFKLLEALAHRKLSELSSGEQSRVLLAKAVVQRPRGYACGRTIGAP